MHMNAQTLMITFSSSNQKFNNIFNHHGRRFDLKEEYADCLLLCRHCRCLFWKSFGHPCIKNDDIRQQHGSGRQSNKSADLNYSNPRNNGQGGVTGPSRQDESRASTSNSVRPSVASLSQSFDRATRRVGSNSTVLGDENEQPSDQRVGTSGFESRQRSGPSIRSRQPLNNLNEELRQHNASRQQRQQYLPPSGRDNTPAAARREEMPKHVTITPQAFLKFFSL